MNSLIKVGLGAAIAIIFPLMVGLGIEAFYPSPKDPYQQCVNVLPAQPASEKNFSDPMQNPTYRNCFEKQQSVVNEHNRNVFVVTTFVGFLAIAAGALVYLESIATVMPGLVFGGIITIFYGAIRGFEGVDKRWLFLELVVLLIGIVAVSWRYLRKSNLTKKGGE